MKIQRVSNKEWKAITAALRGTDCTCIAASRSESKLLLGIEPERMSEHVRSKLEKALNTRNIVINESAALRWAVLHPLAVPFTC